jgi:Phasin protein
MAHKESRPSAKPTIPSADPAEFAEMGKRQVEAMINLQKELVDAIEEVNGEWAARLKAETDLATEFAGKLTAAKSIPETAAICQEWMGRRMEMFAEDSRRFAAGMQKFTAATSALLPAGWRGGSS